jgi:hypothetical protein
LRRERRVGLPRKTPLVFYGRRVWEVLDTHVKLAAFYLYLHRIRRRVERDPSPCTDPALTPAVDEASSPFASRRDKKAIAEAIA